MLNTLVSVLVGGVLGAFFTQKWIEARERRNRRDELRLELYLEVVDLVLNNELAIAERGTESSIPKVDLQTKRLRTSHKLKLLGSKAVQADYKIYGDLVFQETSLPVQDRPKDPGEVVRIRDRLIELMAKDIQGK